MKSSFGVNLGVIAPWSSNQVFLDYFKQSEWYIFEPRDNWFTRQNDAQLNLDRDGWLKSLPTVRGKQQPVMAAVLWDQWHPPGKYVIEYEGTGKLSTDFTPVESRPGRLVVDLKNGVGSSEQLQIYIDSTDPKKTGDYIRDIKVYRLKDESLVKSGELFRPQFINKVKGFSTFRYMDWLNTNFSPVKQWIPAEERVEKSQYVNRVPYEAIAELANQTKTDAWINIPHQASNQFIRQAARYLKQNVDPSVKVYVEYSNEHFTEGFDQFQYFINRGKALFGKGIKNPGEQFYGIRAAQVAKIFRQEFGNQSSKRLFPVLTFAAKDRDVSSVLNAPDAVRKGLSAPKKGGFRVYAVDTYFGFEFGDPRNFATLRRWMKQPDRGIGNVKRAIATGSGLPLNFSALKDLKTDYAFHRKIADRLGWDYTSYEGGSGITTQDFYDRNGDGINDNQDIVDYLISLNQDPAIGQAYRNLYRAWQGNGGGLALHYSDIGFPDWYGSWGLYESVYDSFKNRSPRANFIYSQLSRNGRSSIASANSRRSEQQSTSGDRALDLAASELVSDPQKALIPGAESEPTPLVLSQTLQDQLTGSLEFAEESRIAPLKEGSPFNDAASDRLTGKDTQSSNEEPGSLVPNFNPDLLFENSSSLNLNSVQRLGAINSLQASEVDRLLTPERFQPGGLATFAVEGRKVLAVNDDVAGFQASNDVLLDISNDSGGSA